MRLPRFTTRRLMVLVAVVGIVLGVTVRLHRLRAGHEAHAAKFAEREALYRSMLAGFDRWVVKCRGLKTEDDSETLRLRRESIVTGREYYAALRRKYDRATQYPWLTVPPDPPAPDGFSD